MQVAESDHPIINVRGAPVVSERFARVETIKKGPSGRATARRRGRTAHPNHEAQALSGGIDQTRLRDQR
jgi:hypothetical protein